MQIVVCLKPVPDVGYLKLDATGMVAPDSIQMVLNPACGYAIEAAIRLKETQPEAITVTAISLGGAACRDVLKRAIAMGADTGVHLQDPALDNLDAQATAHVLKAAIAHLVPEASLLLFGQFTDDGQSGITGPVVAELFGYPCLTLANKVTIHDLQTIEATRETENSLEAYTIGLPAAVCFANSEHEPRIPSIKGVMRANRTEIPVKDLASLGISLPTALTQLDGFTAKPQKQSGEKITADDPQVAVDQLIQYLQAQSVL